MRGQGKAKIFGLVLGGILCWLEWNGVDLFKISFFIFLISTLFLIIVLPKAIKQFFKDIMGE